MAQADELARLRDEVRSSAEHEALEIVTAARRDIRQIVMEARRELFVLSAQVQAALGEGGAGTPQLGPPTVAHDDERLSAEDELSAFAQEEWGFAPRSTVAAVLEEARHDMAVLDQDARAVPSVPPTPSSSAETPLAEAPAPESPVTETLPPAVAPAPAAAATEPFALPSYQPVEGHDPSSIRRFAAAFVLAAVVVVLATVWMLRGPSGDADSEPAAPAPSAAASAPAAGASGAAATPAPTEVTLSVEAVRPAWIRAVVDGRSDAGQTLRAGETHEFTGRTIALRVGDAGAVRVSVNGSEARPLGRDGQVLTREFTLDGPPPAAESPGPAGAIAVPEPAPSSPDADETAALPEDQLPAATAPLVSFGTTPSAVTGTNGPIASPATPAIERASALGAGPDPALMAAAQRWLDAYQRQDEAVLEALSTSDVVIADERPTGERMPAAAAIARTIDRINVQLAADTAVLTGVMTERAVDGGLERSSPMSLVWVWSGGAWRLSQARFVSQSTLRQIFR